MKLTPKEVLDLTRIGAGAELLMTGDVSKETADRYWTAYRRWLEEAGLDADEWMRMLADPWRLLR